MGEHKYTKARVEYLEGRVMRQREEIQGLTETLSANNAIIAAILEAVGSTEEKPVTVDQEKIKEAMQGKYVPMVEVKDGVYLIHCREIETEGKSE